MRVPTSVHIPALHVTVRNRSVLFDKNTIISFVNRVMEALLYLSCFFPFIVLVYIGSDTQPYGMLMGMFVTMIYVWREKTLPKTLIALIFCGIIMLFFALTGIGRISTYMVLRSYSTYATLAFVPCATFLMMKRYGGMNELLVKLSIWIWFGVGFMQKYVNPEFGYALMARHDTNHTRGVVSLSTEPSAYGYVCIVFILLCLQLKKNKYLYIGLLLVQILMFASSSVTIMYLVVYAGAFVLNELLQAKKYVFIKMAAVFGCGCGGIYYIRNYMSRSNRIRILVDYAFDNPQNLLKDGSIKRRLMAITDTFGMFAQNKGLPHGLSDYKYMSGVGLILVEGGIIGVIILSVIAYTIWQAYPKRIRIFYVVGFMLMMVSAITFASPIICFYLGYCAYMGWEREKEKEKQLESTLDM